MQDFLMFDELGEPDHGKDNAKICTLSRGNLAKFDETHLKKMQELLREKKFKDVEGWILSAKLSQNFSGIGYSVLFRTNKPIILWSLGFWGPFNESEGTYNVQIMVAQLTTKSPSDSRSDERPLEKLSVNDVKCQRREIFTVHLPQSVLLPSNTWIRIRFQLDGPDTAICSSIKGEYICENNLIFEFFDSSHQIAQINYSLP